jgi:hypothetical protein
MDNKDIKLRCLSVDEGKILITKSCFVNLYYILFINPIKREVKNVLVTKMGSRKNSVKCHLEYFFHFEILVKNKARKREDNMKET